MQFIELEFPDLLLKCNFISLKLDNSSKVQEPNW